MPRFAANLSMLYNEHAFLDRFAAAAADGFTAVEYLFPYAFAASDLAARLRDNGLQQVLFNGPPGDWDGGERGMACLPGREDEFKRSIEQALGYAAALRCPRVHVMAGAGAGRRRARRLRATYVANLAWAAAQAAPQGVDILIEPINTRDIPGFFLNRQDQAHEIVADVGAANLKVQMDLYHCQIVEGDLAKKIEQVPARRRASGTCRSPACPNATSPTSAKSTTPTCSTLIDRAGLRRLDRLRVPPAHRDARRHLGRPGLVSTLPESTTS